MYVYLCMYKLYSWTIFKIGHIFYSFIRYVHVNDEIKITNQIKSLASIVWTPGDCQVFYSILHPGGYLQQLDLSSVVTGPAESSLHHRNHVCLAACRAF